MVSKPKRQKLFLAGLEGIKSLDANLLCRYMSCRHSAALARAGRTISRTGDGYCYALIALLLYWLDYEVPPGFYASLILAYAAERSLYYMLKLGFRRNRPAAAIAGFTSAIKPADQFSFPSGHTSGAFLFAVYMSLLAPALAPLLLLWATLVGLSRFCLGVHFLTDILMGALLGSAIGYLSLTALLG